MKPRNSEARLIGGHLRERRLTLGLTLKEVGHKIGVSLQEVAKWEAGQHAVDNETLTRFAHIYKCSVHDFRVTAIPLSTDAIAVAKAYDAIRNGGLRQVAKEHVCSIQEWEAHELK